MNTWRINGRRKLNKEEKKGREAGREVGHPQFFQGVMLSRKTVDGNHKNKRVSHLEQ